MLKIYGLIIFTFILAFNLALYNAKNISTNDSQATNFDRSNKIVNNPLITVVKDSKRTWNLTASTFKVKSSSLLINTKECQADIGLQCEKQDLSSDFRVLRCLQKSEAVVHAISDECQNKVWNFKLNLTRNPFYTFKVKSLCKEDINNIEECNSTLLEKDHLISCLIEHKRKLRSESCLKFLNKIATVIFSDYRLVLPLLSACQADINQYKCGRLRVVEPANSSVPKLSVKNPLAGPNSQGRSIDCLVEHLGKLNVTCQHQILRLGELQSDDYHLDTGLYYACRSARETLCKDIRMAGKHNVFSCLLKNKNNPMMPEACVHQLIKRQKLTQFDYKVDYGFSEACKGDILNFKCRRTIGDSLDTQMSSILLCLEGVSKVGQGTLTAECKAEVASIRRQLMSDYKLHPEIVVSCKEPIATRCGGGLQRGGKTLHCLFGLQANPANYTLPLMCSNSLRVLFKVVDPGESIGVDPIVWRACNRVHRDLCPKVNPWDSQVYSCLMRGLDSPAMTRECSKSLIELQYFVSRDFKLDPALFRACRSDARTLCKVSDRWFQNKDLENTLTNEKEEQEPDEKEEQEPNENAAPVTNRTLTHFAPEKVVFHCLFQHSLSTSPTQLRQECGLEIHRVLLDRSKRVRLNPLIYQPCKTDLAHKCADKIAPGTELECLQKNYDTLQNQCQLIIRRYTRKQEMNLDLAPALVIPCRPFIYQHCNTGDKSKVLECLIKSKYDEDMPPGCRAMLFEYQKVRTKDFRMSEHFMKACSSELSKFCSKLQRTSVGATVSCLAEQLTQMTGLAVVENISPKCMDQLEFQMRQLTSDIRLDSVLYKNCLEDKKKFCDSVEYGYSRVINCLKLKQYQVSDECHRTLFNREIVASVDNRADGELLKTCHRMIRLHCPHRSEHDILLHCLRQHMLQFEGSFDSTCGDLVLSRMEINSRDYRLNRPLEKSCRENIRSYCQQIVDASLDKGKLYEGRVKDCLMDIFLNGRASNKRLTESCTTTIRNIVLDVNLNYALDARLGHDCKHEIIDHCTEEISESSRAEVQRRITACLMAKIGQGQVKSVACQSQVHRQMELTKRADVESDPQLKEACSLELATMCKGVPRGDGKQMSCLLWMEEHPPSKGAQVSVSCRKQIDLKRNLWAKALKAYPPQTLNELASQINASSSRIFFIVFCSVVIFVIFVVGLCCGRGFKKAKKEFRYTKLR